MGFKIDRLYEHRRRRMPDRDLVEFYRDNPLASKDDAYRYLVDEGYDCEDAEYFLREGMEKGDLFDRLEGLVEEDWDTFLNVLTDMGFVFNDRLYSCPVVWIDAVRKGHLFEIEVGSSSEGYYVVSAGDLGPVENL